MLTWFHMLIQNFHTSNAKKSHIMTKKAIYFLMVHQTHMNVNYFSLFKTRIVCILGESNFLNGPMSSRKPGDSIVNNICGGTQSEEESILWLIIHFMEKWHMTRNTWLQGGSIGFENIQDGSTGFENIRGGSIWFENIQGGPIDLENIQGGTIGFENIQGGSI